MNRLTLITAVMALVTMSAFAQDADTSKDTDDGKLSLGDYPPELNVEFVKRSPVELVEEIGKKVVVVEFWATWCAPCKESIPHLTKLQKKYGKDGLVIVGISDESILDVQLYLDRVGSFMDYTVAVDRRGNTKKRYFDAFGISGIPQAFVIDVNGRIAWQGHPNSPFMDRIIPILLEDVPGKKEVPADE